MGCAGSVHQPCRFTFADHIAAEPAARYDALYQPSVPSVLQPVDSHTSMDTLEEGLPHLAVSMEPVPRVYELVGRATEEAESLYAQLATDHGGSAGCWIALLLPLRDMCSRLRRMTLVVPLQPLDVLGMWLYCPNTLQTLYINVVEEGQYPTELQVERMRNCFVPLESLTVAVTRSSYGRCDAAAACSLVGAMACAACPGRACGHGRARPVAAVRSTHWP